MANPRVAHSIFCDDVRFEFDGKKSFIGCYDSGAFIPVPFPTVFPRLTIATWLIVDKNDLPQYIKRTVILPDGAEVQAGEIPELINPNDVPDDVSQYTILLLIPPFPLPLAHEGKIEVWIETETGKIKAGRLDIKPGPAPAAAPPIP